ncbi:hypothetical protein C0993_006266 [Termitomyces sp. T159_Od127]|nr:hypothetical protein C0993_006266 [Termitomyces sp. T159_Od127]
MTHMKVAVVILNAARIDTWNSPAFNLPTHELVLDDIVCQARGKNLTSSTDDLDKSIKRVDLILIYVNTRKKKSGVDAGSTADLEPVSIMIIHQDLSYLHPFFVADSLHL